MTSLINFKSLSRNQILSLLFFAESLKTKPRPARYLGETIGLIFFEPSTRTRMSFETAAHRVGLGPLTFDGGGQGTSLAKGETLEDTLVNIAAMNPRFLVLRSGDQLDFEKLQEELPIPIINAGWGVKAHPTQTLLDALTIKEHFSTLDGLKILIVGDIVHSRVASSHFEFFEKFQSEVGICGPDFFLPKDFKGNKFSKIEEGLEWADVVITLRVQFERHQTTEKSEEIQSEFEAKSKAMSNKTYQLNFGINSKRFELASGKAILMHPGPINHGIELETDVLSHPRCHVLKQVSNGVFLREAVIRTLMGETE